MKIVVKSKVPTSKVSPWKGTHPLKSHYRCVVDGDCDVYNKRGEPILFLRRGRFSEEEIQDVMPSYKKFMKFPSDSRASYAGLKPGKLIKKDGTLSNTHRAVNDKGQKLAVYSAIGGYYEPVGGRFPMCRVTTFTRDFPEDWAKISKNMKKCASIYKSTLPDRYQLQMTFVHKTHPAWVIKDTPYSTITVNNTVAAAYHEDKGDLKEGFGCMLCLRYGDFSGFELVVPEYGLAVDMQHGDFLMFNPLIWHGNIPPYRYEGEKNKDWGRISVVMYLRDRIVGCLSPEDELKKAKRKVSSRLEL